jgi:hypothetical protein
MPSGRFSPGDDRFGLGPGDAVVGGVAAVGDVDGVGLAPALFDGVHAAAGALGVEGVGHDGGAFTGAGEEDGAALGEGETRERETGGGACRLLFP